MSPGTPPITVISPEAKQALRLQLRSRQGAMPWEGITKGRAWWVLEAWRAWQPRRHSLGAGAVLGTRIPSRRLGD